MVFAGYRYVGGDSIEGGHNVHEGCMEINYTCADWPTSLQVSNCCAAPRWHDVLKYYWVNQELFCVDYVTTADCPTSLYNVCTVDAAILLVHPMSY